MYTEIYQKIEDLKSRTANSSISPDELFSLMEDLTAKTEALDLASANLNIKKVYNSITAMNADASPIDDTGRSIRTGQLVCVFDANNIDNLDNGKVYRKLPSGWEYSGYIGELSNYNKKTDSPVYNITFEKPLTVGYYTAETARAAVPVAVRKKGLELLYSIAANTWMRDTYMNSDVAGWSINSNWKSYNIDLDKVIEAKIVDNVTTDDDKLSLSAKQGKALDANKVDVTKSQTITTSQRNIARKNIQSQSIVSSLVDDAVKMNAGKMLVDESGFTVDFSLSKNSGAAVALPGYKTSGFLTKSDSIGFQYFEALFFGSVGNTYANVCYYDTSYNFIEGYTLHGLRCIKVSNAYYVRISVPTGNAIYTGTVGAVDSASTNIDLLKNDISERISKEDSYSVYKKIYNQISLMYDSWADNYQGWYVVATGIQYKSTSYIRATVDLRVYSLLSTLYAGTEAISDIIRIGIYQDNATISLNGVTTSNFTGSINVGINAAGYIVILIGGDAYKWRSVLFSVDKCTVASLAGITYDSSQWSVSKLIDTTGYIAVGTSYTPSPLAKVSDVVPVITSLSNYKKIYNHIQLMYDSWADNYQGWYVVTTGIQYKSTSYIRASIDLRVYSLYSTAYVGTEGIADVLNIGIYQNVATIKLNGVVGGNFTGSINVGINAAGYIVIHIGGDAYKWRAVLFSVDKCEVASGGSIVYDASQWAVAKLIDTTGYIAVGTAYTLPVYAKTSDIVSIDKNELIIHEARRLSNRAKLSALYANIRKYNSMLRMILLGDSAAIVAGTALKAEYMPLKVLFTGSSFTNLQWDLSGSPTVDMNSKPLGFQNPDHWTTRLLRCLNPKALTSTGAINLAYGNMSFLKVGQSGITVNGTYQYNRYVSGAWVLSDCGGYHDNGEHQFAFFKAVGDYVEFTVPANAIGYSIIMDKFSGTRTDGTATLAASDSVTIMENGVTKATVSLVGSYSFENSRFDFQKTSASAVTVRVTNNAAKWMPIWGLEYWTDCCIRPINNAISGATVETLLAYKDNCVGVFNSDVIVWQPTLSNDGALTYKCYELYKSYLDFLLTKTANVIMVLQAPSVDIASTDATYEQFQERKSVALMLAAQYSLPIVDVGSYLLTKYGKSLPTSIMGDGIHLTNAAHIEVSALIDKSFGYII